MLLLIYYIHVYNIELVTEMCVSVGVYIKDSVFMSQLTVG